MRRVLLILLALLAAGCVAPAGPVEPASVARGAAPVAAPAAPAAFASSSRDVALAVEDAWVRPEDTVRATAEARDASTWSWLLASRNPVRGGHAHATGGADPASFPSVRVPARETSGAFAFDRAGRFTVGVEDAPAWFNVTVRPDVPAESRSIVRVEAVRSDGVRFVPADATVGKGSSVVFVNARDAPSTLVVADAMDWLSGEGPDVAFSFPGALELGDYDLVVVVEDGAGARGVASHRLVYDNRKPDPEAEFGPYEGTLTRADDAASRGFASRHPLVDGTLSWRVVSDAPLAVAARVELLDAGGTVVVAGEGAEGAVDAPRLEAGEYALRVTLAEGALARFETKLVATRELVAPESFFSD